MKNKLPTDGNHDAFPCVQQGLTKRELFAAMAMQGICSKSNFNPDIRNKDVVACARSIADALIEELNK